MKKKNNSNKLINLVNKTHKIIIKQNLIKPREFILVTMSGGQDSICLFFILLQFIRGTGTRGLSLLNWRKSIANFSYTKPELHFEKKIFVLYFCTILLYKFQTHFQTFSSTRSVQKTPGLFYQNKQSWVILHE